MYLKFFGFREAPFNLTPDPKFYFSSSLHREALAALYYGIRNKKGFVVVTGEVGTGKTTLLRKVLRSLDATNRSVFVFNTLLTFDDLLAYVLRDLGVEPTSSGRGDLIQQLNDFLLETSRRGQSVSLLIDEAQQLSEETLEFIRFLSNLETDREKLIQIILVGQPELEITLNRASLRQLKQRISLWARLDRLAVEETKGYIEHRLNVAGYEGPSLFDSAAMRLIAAHADGTPRLVNSICDNALLTAFALSKRTVTVKIVEEVVGDLRLVPVVERANEGSVDAFEARQAVEAKEKEIRSTFSEKGRGGTRNRTESETISLSQLARHEQTVKERERIYNFELRRETAGYQHAVPVQQSKHTKNVAVVKEFNERQFEDRERKVEKKPTHLYVAPGAEEGTVANLKLPPMHGKSAVVPAELFDQLIKALTNAMGPMASIVLRDQVAAMGECLDEFPIARLGDLVEVAKREILSEGLRRSFEKDIAVHLRVHIKSEFSGSHLR